MQKLSIEWRHYEKEGATGTSELIRKAAYKVIESNKR